MGSADIALVPVSAEGLDAELAGDVALLAAVIPAVVHEWPPIDGEWDRDAMEHVRSLMADPTFDASFGAFYVVADGALVANAGFFGPPDAAGEVEIGYSVCRGARGRGRGTAAVAALCAGAAARGVVSVRARVDPQNVASATVLQRNGFVAAAPAGSDGLVVWRLGLGHVDSTVA